ncbi:hypothetical protein MHU86_1353 [Fragilaria crotonensis]|nr:hypothetical protein MHU86_23829 [Fragilaria crotonensis]KAI2513061.1 hypothetical protein MHU86_1353 [Fragilaria crotonensis]
MGIQTVSCKRYVVQDTVMSPMAEGWRAQSFRRCLLKLNLFNCLALEIHMESRRVFFLNMVYARVRRNDVVT